MRDNSKLKPGCILILLAPLLDPFVMIVRAWCAKTMWGWYPPFGLATPSIPGLVVIFSLAWFLRPHAKPNDDAAEHPLAAALGTMIGQVIAALVVLSIVAAVRWICS